VEFYGIDPAETVYPPNYEELCGSNAVLIAPKNMQYIRKCICKPGFVGEGFHCEDVDECIIGDNVCGSPDRLCLNNEGSFSCECGTGFTRNIGDDCEDIDECATNPRDVCPYMTECINTVGSFICDCKEPGYLADGKQCVDIDECKNGNHTCMENAVCVNALGSFVCFCAVGYTG